MGSDKIETAYKGFFIETNPEQLIESGYWTIKVWIGKERGGSVSGRYYYASNKFKTKDEANTYCFDFGRRIIDGEFMDLTVNDL